MHLTRTDLIRIAGETAEKSALSDSSLVAAYLTGSLRSENPFLGNTTDIDIVYIHADEPRVRREIVSLTPEIHFDIIHNPRSLYDRPRDLRVHPWLGPELYDPISLYASHHILEFVQAGVRDRFYETSSLQRRSHRLTEEARQALSRLSPDQSSTPENILDYLKTIHLAANAVAVLTGELLSERRFLLQFPVRARDAGQADLIGNVFGLLGTNQVDGSVLTGYLPEWEKSFVEAVSHPGVNCRIASPRLAYYKQAFEAMLASEVPQAIVWPLLLTWTLSAKALTVGERTGWSSVITQLGLDDHSFANCLERLEEFILSVEAVQARAASDSSNYPAAST
jgi:hypothetical protein